MSKYEKLKNTMEPINLQKIIVDDEEIIWSGKPKKSAFIIYKVVTMLPIALIWLLFDSAIISMMLFGSEEQVPVGILIFLIGFFSLHLFPVWIWLSNVITANKRWKNTEYAVTNKRLIISDGFIGKNYQSFYYKEIEKVDLNISAIDRMLKVGDISATIGGNSVPIFVDIENVYDIYPKLQKIVLDIQTDMEYPNEYRPKENPGYNTKYNGKM